MKILHIIPDIAKSSGGPVEALKTMSTVQSAAGHNITIATTDFGFGPKLKLKNVEIKMFPYIIASFRYSIKLKEYLINNISQFDIVHLHSIWTYPTYIAGKLAKKYNIPYILRPCGMLDEWSFSQKYLKKIIYYTLFEKNIIKNASFIHFTSTLELRESKKYRSNSRTYILPLAINIGNCVTSSNSFKEFKPYILFFSRLHQIKQPDLLIEAFAKIYKKIPNYKLILAGPCEDNYKQSLLDTAEKNKISQKIIFTGMLTGDDKISVLKNADLFILPSLHENFGIAVAEAMALGCPVLISKNVALADVVVKNNTGIVSELTIDDLSSKIIELISSPEKKTNMGKNGINYVQENLSAMRITKKQLTIYQDLLKK